MALPAPKIDPGVNSPLRFPRKVREEPHEALFRPVEKPHGKVVVEKIPL